MYHLRRIKSLVLTLLVCTVAHAQIESGKVYNFVNIGNAGKSMTYISENKLSIATTDNTDYKQLWYVEGNANSGYTLRSMANGYYLRSQNSANNTSWTTVKDIDNNCRFSCIAAGNGYTLRATNTTNDQHCMHYGSGTNSIVCWYSTANASQWTLTEVSLTEEELTANWEYVTSLRSGDIYQTALAALFTDNSCSELKPAYASYTKNQMMNNSYYLQLPSTLQKMVLKMCTDGTWQENNYDNSKESWSAAYAKKYRVQLYEPYNNISAASKALSLNEHTNMNNPTGIFSGKREAIYVMVQGKINDGASLYLDSYTGHNKLGTDHKKGIQLTEGLNIIPSDVAGRNYFINYVVETFDTSDGKRGHEAKARSLKDYAPLKIHIEGGYINGYYNKVGDALYGSGDKNTDWEYIEARATQTDVTVLGKYMTLQFPLRDEDTEQYVDEKDGNKVKWHKGLGSYLNEFVKIEDVINSWDNVMMWERLLLGVLDENTVNAEAKQSPYSITDSKQVIEYTGNDQEFPTGYGDYYNIHGLAYGVGGSAYMYGSGDHSGYHYNTMGGIIQNMPTNAGSHWGPAHEIGHQHQNLLKIRKEMEVTNNLFSNVVLWYFGETTSRVNGTEGSLENILNNFNKEDGHYLTNNIWGMTQMYYKLFLYYHVLGHNPKFYPRLFEILRQDPSNGMAGTVDGEEAQLHIYKKMCQAAGEDLTEFFRAHGFLRPLDGFAIDDYGVSTFYMTQAQIDAAIAEVKSWNYKENVAVLFINDATGETIKSHKGDNLELYGETRVCAEVGGYASFEESITNAGDLDFTVSGKTVTVNKGGGVGYAIFNEKGEIIAFSDKKTFTVSDECATALMWGEATVKVVNADNSVVNVENVDEVASKYTLLGELITEADAELTYLDATNTKVGYYKEGVLTALQAARDEAKVVYDNQDTQSYIAAYAKLYGELYAVTHDEYNRVSLMAGGTYRLKSRNTSNWMSVNGNNVTGETSNESSTSQQWVFEAAGEDDTYYIKNASTSLYIGGAEKGKQVATQAEAKAYKVASVETGVWTLQCQDSNLQWLNHNGGKVLGWNDGNDHNSQWYITFKGVTQDAQKLHELKTLVQQTRELIDEMAEVTPVQKLGLQINNPSSVYYLSTNACYNTLNNASDGQGLAGILDESTATYFHSDYGNKVSGTHYLQVDLGQGHNLSDLIFYYTTRDNGNNCPTTIEVLGSNDGNDFSASLYTFTGLPTEGAQSWESQILTNVAGYRYLRFMVTSAEGGNRYFVMSTFGLARSLASVQSVGNIYANQGLINNVIVDAYASIHSASDKIKVGGATLDELSSLYSQLETKYNNLEDIYNAAHSAGLIAKKAELQELINVTTDLIEQCGTISVVEAVADTEVTNLQTTNPNGDYYVWTNAQSTQEGPISGLIDGLYGTGYTDKPYYFHSAYSGETITDGLKHHITINLGANNAVSAFKFQYRNRTNSGVGFPAEIEVYGSIDGSSYNKIITLNDMEKNSTTVYTSPVIETSKGYDYLRFMITKSSGGKSYFHMAEFDLYIGTPSYYDVSLNGTHGDVDDEKMIATYDAVVAAQASVNIAATEAQLQKAIDKLQAQYNALVEAKNAAIDFTISSNIAGGGVRYQDVYYTTKLSAPSTLTTEALTAMQVDGYVAKSITINGATISVVYNKVYIVTITGGEGEGRVTFGDDEYANDGTFDASQNSFTAADVQAKNVEGYTKSEVTVNHETGVISVTYTLDKSALNDLLEETLVLIHACNGFVNSEFVTAALLEETNSAWTTAQNALETVQTRSELSDALDALQAAHDKLNTAKEEAIAEMHGQLSNLITETDNLVKSCYDGESFKYAGSFNVTEALITKTNEVLETATETRGSEFNAESYESALLNLTTAKQNLATAIAYATLPVQLTFDANSPVTYKITIDRTSTTVLAYDATSGMVAVTDFELGNKSHGWYFMATTNGKVRIMPYHELNTTLALSTNSFAQDNSKVKGMPIGTDGYTQEWTITNANMNEANRNAGWYNITTTNPSNTATTWYFSNHGGVSNKMGFYNDPNDNGSRFKFEQISFDKSAAYYALYNYYYGEMKVASSKIQGGDAVGYYPTDKANAYNSAYSNATSVLESLTASDEDYTNAYDALKAANEALELIMPKVGTYYTIVSACDNNNRNGQLMYATGENGMKFANDKAGTDGSWIRPEALWTFTEEGYMMNLQTGCHVGTSTWGGAMTLVEDDAKVVSIEPLATLNGQVLLKPGGGYPLHAQVSGSEIVGYSNENNASAWRIVEVEDMSLVNFALTISQYRHAGLYLNYSVEIPEGVKAYIAHSPNGAAGEIIADELEGSIIPARTAVIVKGNANTTYSFKYTTETNTTDSDKFEANLLGGSAYLKYQAPKEGYLCCNFAQKNGDVGLYKNWIQYTDTNGSTTITEGEGEDKVVTDYAKSDNGTYFKISANKIYYEYQPATVVGASAFRFRFNDKAEGTTAIDELILGDDVVIYNLYGQRIVEIVEPGIYIINGKKIYVSEKMILNND